MFTTPVQQADFALNSATARLVELGQPVTPASQRALLLQWLEAYETDNDLTSLEKRLSLIEAFLRIADK